MGYAYREQGKLAHCKSMSSSTIHEPCLIISSCPIEVHMEESQQSRWQYDVQIRAGNESSGFEGERAKLIEVKCGITSLQEVEAAIRDVLLCSEGSDDEMPSLNQSILSPRLRVSAGQSHIVLTIKGKGVPGICFVDVPGKSYYFLSLMIIKC